MILVVSSEPLERELLLRTLRAAGHQAEAVGSGAAARVFAVAHQGEPVRLVVLDAELPGAPAGDALIGALRETLHAPVPVLGLGHDRDALVALTLATDYACRPLRHTWILESAEEHDR